MNLSIIRKIIGTLLKTEAVLLLLPVIFSIYYHEKTAWAFLVVAAICGVLGILLGLGKPSSTVFYLREGCVATALSWIVLSVFGCLPFYISGQIPSFIDALFETVSGFTTTGASILSDIEALDKGMLFWRSFTHWVGGMGVLVFIMAIIPLGGGSDINVMKAESPGPTVGKLVPKMKSTARILYVIYFVLTVLEFIFLVAGKMPIFDSICTAVGTAGTGGFGIKNDSFCSYSVYLQWVVTIFMILFGVNFNAYYFLVLGQVKKALAMEEVKVYFGVIFAATAFITFDIVRNLGSVFEAVTQAAFQVGSMITTTGFSTADFDQWSGPSRTIMVLLMFSGACAGSTGGGLKVSRLMIGVKSAFKELVSYIHPKSIKKVKMDGKALDDEIVRSVDVYLIVFMILYIVSDFLISFEGYDLETNFTAIVATINNIGPGLSKVGPTCNFGFFNAFSKSVFIFDMLAGRLELFPMLILFHPGLWKETAITTVRKHRARKK